MTGGSATWPSIPLGELGTWYGGGTPSKARDDFWTVGTLPWLSPKDMGPEVVHATQDLITDSAVAGSAVRLVPPGSVAVVVRSGILERTVPIALVPMATTLNQDMKALVPREGIDPRWVAWGLRSKERQLMERCRKAGTTVASIDTKRLMAEELPVPPLGEQQRILDLLEEHLSRLDSAASSLSAAGRRLGALRRSALQSLVGGPVVSLGELTLESGYGTSTKCTKDGAGVPVVRIPNLVDGRIDLSDEKRASDLSIDLRSLMLAPGDLLVVRTNGSRELIGRPAVVQAGVSAAFASYLIRFRVDQSKVRPEWVRLMLEVPTTRVVLEGLAASSAGQYNLSLAKLNGVEFPCPDLTTQDARLAEAEAASWTRVRLAGQLRSSEQRLKSLKRSLMAAAFSGRLTGASTAIGGLDV